MMNDFFDLTTLIFIGIAIVVLLRLRSVLGTRTGTERPPSNRIKPSEKPTDIDNDKVVNLHPAKKSPSASDKEQSDILSERARRDLEEEIEKFANGDETLAKALKEINKLDSSFTPKSFISGAKYAYEMIVTAFAKGDKRTLKNLLAKDVFEGFSQAIKTREDAGYKVDFTFVGLPKVEFSDARLEGNIAFVTIRFFAEIVSATRDENGNLIEGNADQVANIADSWTFSRNVKSKDPNWKLVATDQLD